MRYLPGRTLTSAGSLQFWSWVRWLAWGLGGGLVIRLLALPISTLTGVAIVAGVPIAYTFVARRRLRAYDVASQYGLASMQKDAPLTAEREFALLRDRFRWPRWLRRRTDYNRAIAIYRLGRHKEAIELLAAVDRGGGGIGIDTAIASTLAYLYALCGDTDSAEVWLREARERETIVGHTSVFEHLLTETAIGLRRGNNAEVAKHLADQWPQIENVLTGERLRPLRVLRAFAITRSSDPREAGRVTPYLAALQPARVAEFRYLATEWPELHGFLVTHFAK